MQPTIVCAALLLVSFVAAQEGVYPYDLHWERAEESDYYDFVGVLEYCVPGNAKYGYRDGNSQAECTSPGPTIRMTRGTKYLLYLRNYNVNLTELSPAATNIHTHGLMVHGSSNGDDITRVMTDGDGEECIGYNYTIVPEHAGGLCWYHAHSHGSTQPQVSNGAYGALIVSDQDPHGDWPQFPTGKSTKGLEELNDRHHERLIFFGAVDSSWHINGNTNDAHIQPIYEDTWYRLRLLVSQPAGTRTDIWYQTESTNHCEFRIQAFDGHWVSTSPLDPVTHFNISASGRVDAAMKCPRDDGRGKEHTLVIEGEPNKAIFRVQRENGEKSIASPWVDQEEGIAWKVNSPPWQQDMMNEVVTADRIHNVTLSPTNVNFDGTIYQYDPNVNCSVLQYDTVYEFNVFRTSVHPYHLHAYPMQVQSGCEPHLIGEFYDTMSSMETDCTVRFRTLGESGKTPMHCHLLRHEDAGAMTWMWVEGGPTINDDPEPPVNSCRASSQ